MKLNLIGMLFGIGLGFFVQRAGLCFAVGLGEVFMGRGKRIVQMFLVIFIITVVGFYFGGFKAVGQIRGLGFYNLVSGLFFGAGIFMCGGCILGSLRQLGEGNAAYLVVVLSMIPGMALVVRIIDPIMKKYYAVQSTLVTDLVPVSAGVLTAVLAGTAAALLVYVTYRKGSAR